MYKILLTLAGFGALISPALVRGDDWPHWFGTHAGAWRENQLVDRFPKGGPPVLWRTPIGAGYSGPAVSGGRVYVMDRERAVDASGKPVRPKRTGIPGNERVLCLNEADGKLIWKYEYPCSYKISFPTGPRTTPAIDRGRVYALGAMGNLMCLDADNGHVEWQHDLMRDYRTDPPPWGYAAHPLVDDERVYCLVGGANSAVVAFDKNTGKVVWKALSTEDIGYSPPVIIEAAGKRQLLIWLSAALYSLDPATGATYWSQPYPIDGKPVLPSVTIITMRPDRDRLFVSTYYNGPVLLQLNRDKPGVSVLWRGKSSDVTKPDGIHSVMSTPAFKDGFIYGVCGFGELRCLDAGTGKERWQTMAATTGGKKYDSANAFLIPQGGRFVIFNDQGDLILADLTPDGYHEIDRAHVIEPSSAGRGHRVVCAHPAFADRCVFARNDAEIVCLSLANGQANSRTTSTGERR